MRHVNEFFFTCVKHFKQYVRTCHGAEDTGFSCSPATVVPKCSGASERVRWALINTVSKARPGRATAHGGWRMSCVHTHVRSPPRAGQRYARSQAPMLHRRHVVCGGVHPQTQPRRDANTGMTWNMLDGTSAQQSPRLTEPRLTVVCVVKCKCK